MRPVSPLKVTYQRNLLRGMIISASLMLLPMTIWYYYQDDEMVAINVGDVRQVNVDTQQPKPVNGKTGSGQRGEVGKGLKGRQVDFDHNMRGYGIVQESLPVVTPIDFVHKTTPIGWVDDDFIDAQGPDMVIPEGDGWPIAAEGPIFKKLGKSAREFSFNFEKRTINKPGPNSPTIIRLGAERWPEGPKVQGINNGVVKIILYLDNKGNYLKNGKVNYELVSEEPPNRGFLGALLQMIRDGYYRSPVEYGIPLGCKCTLTYIWCKGKDCKSGVTIVSGNIIVSVQDH